MSSASFLILEQKSLFLILPRLFRTVIDNNQNSNMKLDQMNLLGQFSILKMLINKKALMFLPCTVI